MKSGRRKARADALKILYQRDLNGEINAEQGFALFESHFTKEVSPTAVDEFNV